MTKQHQNIHCLNWDHFILKTKIIIDAFSVSYKKLYYVWCTLEKKDSPQDIYNLNDIKRKDPVKMTIKWNGQ